MQKKKLEPVAACQDRIRICVLPVDVNGRNPKPKNTNRASPTALLPPTHSNKKIQNSSGSSSFICCVSHASGVHKTQMSVCASVLFCP